ncbi:MAG: riboflavin synthase [Bacteroidetes bacterium]|nr:riboflavin synthase [Bacteroidota bacterium]MDA0873465.1 riboflavin synthase [Bacteroidota bacterium]
MFTGIIEETGTVRQLKETPDGVQLSVVAETVLKDVHEGDSIAVNGTCLTVTDFDAEAFTVGLAPETLRRTSLGVLRPGDGVNLERSMPAEGRFGGHVVQGHVDTTGRIRRREEDGGSLVLTIELDPEYLRYLVPKGYVAVDGISLTVIDVLEDAFTLMLIAYTQKHVTLARQPLGYRPNIEVDIFGKYIERLMRSEKTA